MSDTVGNLNLDGAHHTDEPIRIDPEIAAMFPHLSPNEYDEMVRGLRTDGCRTPFVVWAGCNILLDDPIRLNACRALGVPFAVDLRPFTDRQAAEAFVATQLLAQRSLSREATAYFRGKRYLDEKRRHGGARPKKGASGQIVHLKTSERIAQECGVDERTIRRDAKFTRAVDKVVANCGTRAKQAILARHGGLRRSTVLRLVRLPAEEQRRVMQLVHEAGHLPRGALPVAKQSIVVPIRPKALGCTVFRRLGPAGARVVMRTIGRLLIRLRSA